MLNNKVSLYVPSTIHNLEDKNAQKAFTEKALKEFSQLVGGATMIKAEGSWYSDELKQLITEDVNIVYAFCTLADFEKLVEKGTELAKEIAEKMEQEAVSLEVNGKLTFID